MTLVRWQPRTVARNHTDVASEFDRLFDWALAPLQAAGASSMTPAMDVVEDENRYIVHADLPGLNQDDLEITYQDGVLTIQGEKKQVNEEKQGRALVRERFTGRFARNLRLPEKVDVDKIEATFQDGVLELVLPFTPEAQPRKIQIRK